MDAPDWSKRDHSAPKPLTVLGSVFGSCGWNGEAMATVAADRGEVLVRSAIANKRDRRWIAPAGGSTDLDAKAGLAIAFDSA